MKSLFTALLNLGSWLLIGLVLLIGITTLTANVNIFGGYQSFLVQSGSMEPSIMTGDIIVTYKQHDYFTNDVITFSDPDKRIVTHRIVNQKEDENTKVFITKGDANRSEDNDVVPKENVVGKVMWVIPKLGYIVSFSKSPFGFFLFIIIPAVIIVLDQVFKLFNGKR